MKAAKVFFTLPPPPAIGTAKIAYRRIKRGLPVGMVKSNDSDFILPNGAVNHPMMGPIRSG